jgi:hypothetical protein
LTVFERTLQGGAQVAKDKKAAKAAKKEARGKDSKDLRKMRSSWRKLEDEIDAEFAVLVREGYPIEELETLRWDYRYAKLEDSKLTQEMLEFFVAESEALAAGLPPPPVPGASAAPAAGGAPGLAQGAATAQTGADYHRKSQVDLDLVEKYLERRVGRETRSEMHALYKEAFGEDLSVPEKVDLVDMSYHADITGADASRKLSKSEILGTPEEPKSDAPKVEAKAEAAAAPEVKKESKVVGFVMVSKRGVPEGPTRDAKWSAWNPFKFWLIPRRLAGKSVGRYYAIFLVNLVIFILQFALLLVPFAIRGIVTLAKWIWARFLKQKMGSAVANLKEKAAVPPPASGSAPAASAEAKKDAAPAKSG